MIKNKRLTQELTPVISQEPTIKAHKSINKDEKSAYRYSWLHNFIYRTEKYKVNGPESQSFHRRIYELPIQSLKTLNRNNLGFTNQVLCKEEKDLIQLFIPVSISMKIKNIQQISLSQLVAKIGCVLIVSIHINGLKQPEIIEHLSSKIMVQTNRGQSFLLKETEESGKITLKKDKKFLVFTIRDTFPVQIQDDVFLSPFEILNLVFTVTLNSTKLKILKKNQSKMIQQEIRNTTKSVSDQNKVQYNISFNSMRHPMEIPITYATDCRLGVYDLAEQLLQIYSTNKATYPEAIHSFQDYLYTEQQNANKSSKSQQEPQQVTEKKSNKKKEEQNARSTEKKDELKKIQNQVNYNFQPPKSRQSQPLELYLQSEKQKKQKSVKYFQYTHFIIPLYKVPGNSFSTIFIPMFMLALLSIFIFLQREGTFEQQLGSIATFVLGYIALIPSIKDQLPPSQKITLSQIIVYVQSLNCMLSLLDKYLIIGVKRRVSIRKNKLFIISLSIHFICFGITIVLLLLHYFVWLKRYNLHKQPRLSSPQDHLKAWSNPYCDQQFLNYNQLMRNQQKYHKLIVPWPIENLEKEVKRQIQSPIKLKN